MPKERTPEDIIKALADQGITGADESVSKLHALFGGAKLPGQGNKTGDASPSKAAKPRPAEQQLAKLADQVEGRRRQEYYSNPSDACDACGCSLTQRAFFVDGRLRGQIMFASLCAKCFFEKGEGIGWGQGQVYQREPDGQWLLVAGFPPKENQ